jgi:glycosyltransferase involved in cell wall biosynthesis
MEIIAQSHIMLFTSLKEGTPAVVIEAIQAGVPVICHNKFGCGTVVTDTSGVKVAVKSPSVSIQLFSEAIVSLAKNPDVLCSLSCGAATRAEEISCSNQARVLLECYHKASYSLQG